MKLSGFVIHLIRSSSNPSRKYCAARAAGADTAGRTASRRRNRVTARLGTRLSSSAGRAVVKEQTLRAEEHGAGGRAVGAFEPDRQADELVVAGLDVAQVE